MVAGLRVRPADGRSPLPDLDGDRRLHAGIARLDRRHLAIGRTSGTGTCDAVRGARHATDGRKRQWNRVHLERDPEVCG